MSEILPEQTSHAKGNLLENEFAEFMKKELKWSGIRVKAHLSGKFNSKGANVDIIAERLSENGKIFKTASIIYAIASVLTLLFFIYLFSESEKVDGVVFTVFVGFIILGLVFLHYGTVYNKEHALVECKNRKGAADIQDIAKSIREVSDYKSSKDRRYKFSYHYFVSSSGYIENAIRLAMDNKMICYEKRDGKFIEVKYFN